jgi:hypothetical protein
MGEPVKLSSGSSPGSTRHLSRQHPLLGDQQPPHPPVPALVYASEPGGVLCACAAPPLATHGVVLRRRTAKPRPLRIRPGLGFRSDAHAWKRAVASAGAHAHWGKKAFLLILRQSWCLLPYQCAESLFSDSLCHPI